MQLEWVGLNQDDIITGYSIKAVVGVVVRCIYYCCFRWHANLSFFDCPNWQWYQLRTGMYMYVNACCMVLYHIQFYARITFWSLYHDQSVDLSYVHTCILFPCSFWLLIAPTGPVWALLHKLYPTHFLQLLVVASPLAGQHVKEVDPLRLKICQSVDGLGRIQHVSQVTRDSPKDFATSHSVCARKCVRKEILLIMK